MKQYQYQPLPSASKFIRLVTLLPGKFDDELCIRLHTLHLNPDSSPVYDALSYVCGAPAKIRYVAVIASPHLQGSAALPQSFRLQISCNLDEALRHLRCSSEQRVLWVDALSIDQNNLEERGSQVQQMSNIFRLASKTLMWLGPSSIDSELALKTLCDIGSWCQVNYFDEKYFPIDDTETVELLESRVQGLFREERIRKALRNLFSRPYFGRLWIRQEAHLGQAHGIVICGHTSESWLVFQRGALIWTWSGDCGLAASHLVHATCRTEALSIDILLRDSMDASCSEPRDRIYALLGMLPPQELQMAESIIPDYSKSIRDVYASVFRKVYEWKGVLDLLDVAGLLPTESSWPSWLPDWSRHLPHRHLSFHYTDGWAAAEASWPTDCTLRVTGIVAAKVDSLIPFTLPSVLDIGNLLVAFKLTIEQTMRETAHLSKEEFLATCSLLLVAGNVTDIYQQTYPANSPSLAAVKRFVRFITDMTASELRLIDDTSPMFLEFDSHIPGLIAHTLHNRCLIVTLEGHLGLAPSCVQTGDTLAVVLGCPNLIALTPTKNGMHSLLGTCYVSDLSCGEALLGKLPTQYSMIFTEGYVQFYNMDTGESILFDPRIDWDELMIEPPSHFDYELLGRLYIRHSERNNGERYWKRPDATYFRAHGVRLDTFMLI